ncbi:hypothetical protein PG993_010175 [Apiospora rasikravindrae]|uniref:Uncharacterized protein n=1 Tax=Apiospora rasikravindrae TaxID=990691 RepID=A0ABR1SN98_9PEZI
MAWKSPVDITFEEQIGIVALLIYLNLGIAWSYYVCRKSQNYQDFKHRVIGYPPAPVSIATTTTTTSRRAPIRWGRFEGTWYALKRWVFVTASVLFWIGHALLLLVISLGTQLGATVATGARAVYEWTRRRGLWKSRRDSETGVAASPPSLLRRGREDDDASGTAGPGRDGACGGTPCPLEDGLQRRQFVGQRGSS